MLQVKNQEFQSKMNNAWSQVVHMSAIINKWVQRAAQGTQVAAGLQSLLLGIQISQMGAAATMLTIQASAAYATGHFGRATFLGVLAADMTMEMVFLTSQRVSADQARIEAKLQGDAVKAWRNSYN